ncbi:MAG: hypothetical protein H0W19_07750 [Nitrosopumilus sp.]|nr:hypothetical protein [Nitrosopumilus sp.]
MDKTIKFGDLVLGTIGLATIFGIHPARLITFESRPLDKALGSRDICGFTIINRINGIKQMIYKKNFDSFMNNFTNNQRLSINNQFINLNLIY